MPLPSINNRPKRPSQGRRRVTRDLTMVVSETQHERLTTMTIFWLILFLFGSVCAVICVVALRLWLATATVQGLLTCIERSLTNLGNGHAIVGALYLIPAWLFVCAIAQFVSLAYSFITMVVLR
jgi:hypothetical protein